MRLTVLTWNILDGGRGREAGLTETIAAQNADVVFLQEVMAREFVTQLAARLGAECYIAESRSGRHVALLSRLGIVDASCVQPNILRHGLLKAQVEYAPGKRLNVFGVHLAAPAYTLPVELWRWREIGFVLSEAARAQGEAKVIAGDFNSIAPGDRVDLSGLPSRVRGAVYVQGGLLARQVIGRMRGAGFIDAFRALNPHADGFTLPPSPPRVRLDYIFVSAALRAALAECRVVAMPHSAGPLSDHLPVRLELDLI